MDVVHLLERVVASQTATADGSGGGGEVAGVMRKRWRRRKLYGSQSAHYSVTRALACYCRVSIIVKTRDAQLRTVNARASSTWKLEKLTIFRRSFPLKPRLPNAWHMPHFLELELLHWWRALSGTYRGRQSKY